VSTVVELRVHQVSSPLVRPFTTAVRTATAIQVVLVEARSADGRSGWGEAPASWRVTGESPESIRAAVLGPIAAAVIGLPIGDREAWSAGIASAVIHNAAARSAVECALFDLEAQFAGLPLHELLGSTGGTVATGIRTDMTLSATSIDDLLQRADEHRAAGFRTLKVKAISAAVTVTALVELRAALGASVDLRVDANQAWDQATAIRTIRALEDAGVALELVEQPVAANDILGLAAVTAAVNTPILADEAVWTRVELRAIVERHAADLINVKLAKAGGLVEALLLAHAAKAAGLGLIVGCMMESSVGVAAAAGLAAAVAPGVVHDLDAGLWQASSPVVGGLEYRGDVVHPADSAGLGILQLHDREVAA
jgi:L-alanine-DL-glutamate epimerase-like enolase superfamily enzyme